MTTTAKAKLGIIGPQKFIRQGPFEDLNASKMNVTVIL